MRNLKLSFALIIAVLAVGFTVATKANVLGKRVITDCFKSITLKDASNNQVTLSEPADIPAATADAAALNHPFVVAASSPAGAQECQSTVEFCCATVQETENTNAPLIDLGEGEKRYQILDIDYKPE